MRRSALLPLTLLLPLVSVGACGWFGSDSHDLHDALALVPAGSTDVEFVDRSEIADRLGVGDVATGADQADLDRYLNAMADAPAGGSDFFLPSLQTMQSAPFSELDIAWSVVGRFGSGSFQVFRLDGDVDLDDVGDELRDAGFTETDSDGRRHLVAQPASVTDPANGLVAGHYPPAFVDVTLDPGQHLIVIGSQTSAVLATLDGDQPSLDDQGTFDPVLPGGGTDADEADDVEVAHLDDHPACGASIGNLSPAQHAEAVRVSAGLRSPIQTSFVVTDAGRAVQQTARLRFGSVAAATADAGARTRYLATGRLIVSGQGLPSLGGATVSSSGDLVTVDVAYDDPARATEIAERGDGFLLCHVPAAAPSSSSSSSSS